MQTHQQYLKKFCPIRCLLLAVLVLLPNLTPADEPPVPKLNAEQQAELDAAVQQLKLAEIDDSAKNLEAYIQAMNGMKNELLDRVDALVTDLGDDSYQARERANMILIGMMPLPVDSLEKAAESSDLEVRTRARSILKGAQTYADANLTAILKVIRLKGYRDFDALLPSLLLKAVQESEDLALSKECELLLLERVTKADLPAFFEELKNDSPRAQIIALKVVEKHAGDDAEKYLEKLSESEIEEVKITALRLRAGRNDRRILPLLVTMLAAEDPLVRYEACLTLRSFTGENFDYRAGESALRRKTSMEKWSAWVKESGMTAKLQSPLLKREEVVVGTLFEEDFEEPPFANGYSTAMDGTVFNFGGARGRYNFTGYKDNTAPSGKYVAYANGGGNNIRAEVGLLEPNCKYTYTIKVGDGPGSTYGGYEIDLEVFNPKTEAWEAIVSKGETGVGSKLTNDFVPVEMTFETVKSLKGETGAELIGAKLRIQFSGFGKNIPGNGLQTVFDDLKLVVQKLP